jgi:hypothetical protein
VKWVEARTVEIDRERPTPRWTGKTSSGRRSLHNRCPLIEAEPIKGNHQTFRWTRFPDGVFLTAQG